PLPRQFWRCPTQICNLTNPRCISNKQAPSAPLHLSESTTRIPTSSLSKSIRKKLIRPQGSMRLLSSRTCYKSMGAKPTTRVSKTSQCFSDVLPVETSGSDFLKLSYSRNSEEDRA